MALHRKSPWLAFPSWDGKENVKLYLSPYIYEEQTN